MSSVVTRGDSKRSPYRLADAEKRAVESTTFKIPSREEREDLWPGDQVKLIFEEIGERLWVRVVDVLVEGIYVYVGSIESSPLYSDLHKGDEIVFGPENVSDLIKNRIRGFDRSSQERKQKAPLQ